MRPGTDRAMTGPDPEPTPTDPGAAGTPTPTDPGAAGTPTPTGSGGDLDQLPLRVTTLELFFDLVFAFTLTQLASLLASGLVLERNQRSPAS
jgi:hypothetical protein